MPGRRPRRRRPSVSSRSTRQNSCAAHAPKPKLASHMILPALRQLHASLMSRAPDQAIAILQEAGYAAGEGVYRSFAAVNNPTDLDAGLLAETLSDFFTSGGLGFHPIARVQREGTRPDRAHGSRARHVA